MISKSRYHNKLNIVFGESSFYDASQNSLSVSNTQELVSVINEYPFSSLNILSATLVTDEVINALRDNPHLVFLKLGCESDPYTLTREVFDVLNSSSSLLSIDTLFVIGNYTSQEMNYLPFFNKMVVNKYKVSDLLTNDTFVFYEPLKDEELSYLRQYIKANSTIQFKHDYYDSILKEIDAIFHSKDFVYKSKVEITTDEGVQEEYIVGKSGASLLTLDGKAILIANIKDIRKI